MATNAQLVTFAWLLTASATSASTHDPIQAQLSAAGIRPVAATPAIDFTLPSVGGAEVALSAQKGRWVLLTFFATWCGPCASEMPSLQRLFASHGAKGLQVLGVSTDSDPKLVPPYAQKRGLTFPILLDAHGDAARLYHASSIPISYLISPTGAVLGVARGARDWSRLTGAFDALLAAQPPDPGALANYSAGNAPVALSYDLDPPQAEVNLTGPFTTGAPFTLDVDVHWAGNLDDYTLQPPHVATPENVRILGTEARSSSVAGGKQVRYRITLMADTPGTYALDPVELRYIPRVDGSQQAQRVRGPTVSIAAVGWLGGWLAPPLSWGGGALAAAALLAAGLGIWRRRRRRLQQRPAATAPQEQLNALQKHVEAARRARLDGDVTRCMEELITLDELLCGASSPALQALAQKMRYGGYVPSRDEVDGIWRRVERQVRDRLAEKNAVDWESIEPV